MKRLLRIAILVLLVCGLAAPALADSIAPPENRFFLRHRKECVFVNKTYFANGPEGYVLVRTAPRAKTGTPLPNGRPYSVLSVYQDRWGIVRLLSDAHGFESDGKGAVYGWVDMNEMVSDEDYASAGTELTPAADEAALRKAAREHSGARPYVYVCVSGVVIVAAAVLIASLRRKQRRSE